MEPNKQKSGFLKLLNWLFWVVGGATVGGFLFSAGPALMNKPSLTTTLGLIGVAVGVVGALIMRARSK